MRVHHRLTQAGPDDGAVRVAFERQLAWPSISLPSRSIAQMSFEVS